MSYEAWGSPPDPEPTFCPACGNERHEEVNDCPLDTMYQRALAAESKSAALGKQNAELRAALQFYADDQKAVMVIAPVPVHIDSDTGVFDYEPQVVDRGEVARAALQPSTQEVSNER